MPRRAAAVAAAAAPAASTTSTSTKKKTASSTEAPTTVPAAPTRAAAAAKKSGVEEEVEDVFEENESVLAKDNAQLYEAKVLKVQEGKKGNPPRVYFIHYLGWKSKWDKWVGSDALLKKNEITLKLQAQLKQAAKKRPGAAGGGGGGGEGEEGGKSEDHNKRGRKEGGGGGGEGSTVPADPDVEPVVERANDPQVRGSSILFLCLVVSISPSSFPFSISSSSNFIFLSIIYLRAFPAGDLCCYALGSLSNLFFIMYTLLSDR
jgi:hypothetical protein